MASESPQYYSCQYFQYQFVLKNVNEKQIKTNLKHYNIHLPWAAELKERAAVLWYTILVKTVDAAICNLEIDITDRVLALSGLTGIGKRRIVKKQIKAVVPCGQMLFLLVQAIFTQSIDTLIYPKGSDRKF